jgi:Ca2+-dependent lipid-binding protein
MYIFYHTKKYLLKLLFIIYTCIISRTAGSDPYVVVTMDPPLLLPEAVKSSTVIHDLNPVWRESLTVKLASNDLKGIAQHGHVCLSVWDYDR